MIIARNCQIDEPDLHVSALFTKANAWTGLKKYELGCAETSVVMHYASRDTALDRNQTSNQRLTKMCVRKQYKSSNRNCF